VNATCCTRKRTYHTSAVENKLSQYKFLFAPGLRHVRPTPELKEKDPEKYKKQMKMNSEWFKHRDRWTVKQIATRQERILNTGSYRLPQGGFRVGILQLVAERAYKPAHLTIVHKCLSVVMHKYPSKVIPPNFAAFYCRSASRLHIPEVGLAFIQSPWLKLKPTESTIRFLLNEYAHQARKYFLYRIAEGLEPIVPRSDMVKKKEEEGEEEENEDDEATKKAKEDKKQTKTINTWLQEFTATYKELLSDRHSWKPTGYSLSAVASVYACVGDVDTAISVINKIQNPQDITGAARDDIVLALILAQRTAEAAPFLNFFSDYSAIRIPFGTTKKLPPNLIPQKGEVALYLALNDEQNLRKFFSEKKFSEEKIPEYCKPMFSETLYPSTIKCHFGVESRKELLRKVMEEVAAAQEGMLEEKRKITPHLLYLVRNMEGGAGETEETEEQEATADT